MPSKKSIFEEVRDCHGSFVLDSLVVREIVGGNRGVFATEKIPAGTRLLTIDQSLVMKAEESPLKSGSDWLKVVVMLMDLMASSARSSHLAYLDSLPATYDTLMQWSEEEVNSLVGTSIHSICINDNTEQNFQKNVVPLLNSLQSGDEEKSDVFTTYSYELFCKASQAVVTRGFHYLNEDDDNLEGPSIFMIPCIDMLNHDPSPSRRSTVLRRDKATKAFYMDAEREINAGEEVTHTYNSSANNGQLLRTYGFVHPAPPFATPALLSKDLVEAACKSVAGEFSKAYAAGEISASESGTENEDDDDADERWDPCVSWDTKVALYRQSIVIPQEFTVR